jgi:hypothetical protein
MALGLRSIALAAAAAFLGTFYFVSPSGHNLLAVEQEITSVHVDGNELVERKVITDAVHKAVERSDYAALDRMATDFRASKARTTSGVWKLAVFHAQMLEEAGPPGDCAKPSPRFSADWLAHSPASPAAVIVRAAVLEAEGWCLRGGGMGNTVSASASRQFHAKVQEALQLLRDRKKQASVDPHYYAVMARIGIDEAFDKSAYRAMLDEATARSPDYHYVYFDAYRYYQPIWFGSIREVEELGRYASEHAGDDRDGMYARYFWYVFDCRCHIMEQAVDWPRMKQSMRAVMARYPTDWNASNFARISCAMKDGEEAGKWFDHVKGDGVDAWPNPGDMIACKTLAGRTDRSTERCPQAAREGWTRQDVDQYCRPEQMEACMKDSVCSAKIMSQMQPR